MMASRVMDKQTSQDLQNQNQNQQALKCPRCDSSNTKFCYYNNYSLSQPRHFCKACKRYWTRGGTLRNVPVGGGCRKNKRVIVKRSSASSSTSTSSPNPPSNPSIIMSSTSSNHVNPLFYGLPTNPNSELNLHNYPNFNSSRVSNVDRVNGYDLQSQLNALGLGFDPNKQIQAQGGGVTSSNPLLSSYTMFGSSNYPTMASLLASSVHQQKFLKGIIGNKETTTSFQGLVPYEELQQMPRNIGELKMENQMEQVSQTDPSLFWNTGTSFGGANWLDPSINGSSSPSLI